MSSVQKVNGAGKPSLVTSVNGQTGDVTVAAASGVTSVDGNTGPAVVLSGTYLGLTGGTLSGALVGTLSTMTTAIRAGAANWASTGEIRLPSGGAINARNAANNADLGLISANASDQLQLGRDTVPSSDSAVNLGSSARRWATIFGVSVQVGTNPAATGSVRIASTGQINWRNAANSGDIGGFSSNASDQIQCATTLVPSSDSAKDLGASGARWANIYGVIGVFGSATNTASAGAVRMANAAGVNWRNNGNSADIGWTVSSSDLMTTTAGVVAAHLAPASTTGATSAARYFRATASGAPVSGTWVAGDIVPAADGAFWFCTVGGTPGTWVQSGSATYATITNLALKAPLASPTFTGTVTIPDATTATGAASLEQNAAALYGNGSDGNLTVSGSTTITTDKYYDTLTVQNGGTLTASGARIFCKTLCQVDAGGIITASGGDGAAGGTAGASANQGVYGLVAAGGAGGTAAGSTGGTCSSASGGAGGAGGSGSGGAGGAAGTYSTLTANTGTTARTFPQSVVGVALINGSAANAFKGGAGGGGGGGDGTAGGGGGAGGGVMLICARSLVNNGTIKANGGNGGTPASGNRGGGGGGGGGRIDVVYNTKTGSGTITASGGTKGTKSGTGTDGADGAAGLVNEIPNA